MWGSSPDCLNFFCLEFTFAQNEGLGLCFSFAFACQKNHNNTTGYFNMEPELPHQKNVKAGKITFALGPNNLVPHRTICKDITTTGLMRTGQKIKLFRISITGIALSTPTEMPSSMDVIVFPLFAFVSSSEHYLAFCLSQCVRKSHSSCSQINTRCLSLWKAFYFQVNMLNIFFSFPYFFYILFNALLHITHFILGFKAKVWTTFIQLVT